MKNFILAFVLAASALFTTGLSAKDTDREIVAKTVFAESLGETMEGKIAVASVIVNRTTTKGYPHTIAKVCFQKNAFESVTKKSRLWKKVNGGQLNEVEQAKYAECLAAADIALAGEGVPEITAFRELKCKGGEKYFSKLELVGIIGHHRFYK